MPYTLQTPGDVIGDRRAGKSVEHCARRNATSICSVSTLASICEKVTDARCVQAPERIDGTTQRLHLGHALRADVPGYCARQPEQPILRLARLGFEMPCGPP